MLDANIKWERLAEDLRDPSSYCYTSVSWDVICLADNYIRQIRDSESRLHPINVLPWGDRIVAKAIRELSNVGAPSWGKASEVVKTWPQTFDSACEDVLDDLEKRGQLSEDRNGSLRHYIRLYAGLSILRSAYYTIMMRAAHPLGPGLKEGCSIETAMAYMA